MSGKSNNGQRSTAQKEYREKTLRASAKSLTEFYERINSKKEEVRNRALVAFIDETNPDDVGIDYYGVAVVVARVVDLPEIRKKLEAVAGEGYWHTHEAFNDKRYRDILNMATLVSKCSLPYFFFSVAKAPIGEFGSKQKRQDLLEKRRQDLLEEAFKLVHLQTSGRVYQYVIESRKVGGRNVLAGNDKDKGLWRRVARELEVSGDGKLGPVLHVLPEDEFCLWMPDVVAWSIQRGDFAKDGYDLQYVRALNRLQNLAFIKKNRTVKIDRPARVTGSVKESRDYLYERIYNGVC
ncbi:hypothetical protein ACUH9O_08810 [Dermabacteraceae bacterium P13103]